MDWFKIVLLVFTILIGVITFFLKIMHSDVRKNTLETGKNKGRVEQLQIQLENQEKMHEVRLKNQQENTQKAIETLTKKIGELSDDVRMLTNYKMKKE